jgi:peptidoglycan/LPS O-acetylase OafA/YrhL
VTRDSRPSGRYIAALDGLRGCSIAAVIVHGAPHGHGGLAERVFGMVVGAGWAGVQLFFVLSGFLITGILLDTRQGAHFFRNFYARRTLRIFPAYYATLIVTLWLGPLVFSTAAQDVSAVLSRQGWLWTYASNIEILRHNGWCFDAGWLSLDHTWSLAVEEQFYLVWPVLVFLLPRRGLAVVALAIILASPFLRLGMLHGGASPEVVYSFTLCRLDALAMGSLLALVVRSDLEAAGQRRVANGLLLAGVAAVGTILVKSRGFDSEDFLVQTAGFSALAVLCSGLVLWVVLASRDGRSVRFFSSPALRFVGRYSYGMYLYQGILAPLFHRIPVDRVAELLRSRLAAELAATAVAFFGSTAVAFVSWHLFERRFLTLKDRFAR